METKMGVVEQEKMEREIDGVFEEFLRADFGNKVALLGKLGRLKQEYESRFGVSYDPLSKRRSSITTKPAEVQTKTSSNYEKKRAEAEKAIEEIETKLAKLRNELKNPTISGDEREKYLKEIRSLEAKKKSIEDMLFQHMQDRLNELSLEYAERDRLRAQNQLKNVSPRGASLFVQAVCEFCSNAKMCDAYRELDAQKMLPCIFSELLIAIGPKPAGFRLEGEGDGA